MNSNYELHMCCPQLIDPALDYLSHLLLTSLRGSAGSFQCGVRVSRRLVKERMKPLMIIVCTDAFGADTAVLLEELRLEASIAGIPVVHALSRRGLGGACGTKHCLTSVAVMHSPNEHTQRLMGLIMQKAADAYAGYIAAFLTPLSSPLSSPLSPQQSPSAPPFMYPPSLNDVSFCELPPDPFALPASLTHSLSALAL